MNAPREFRPELLSRRSEFFNWALAVIALATWVFLRSQVIAVSGWYLVFVLMMMSLAVSTSLSHWIERNTLLTLKPEGIDFNNKLRNISLKWEQVQEIRVDTTRFGNQVFVAGVLDHTTASHNTNFTFRTLSVYKHKGEVRNKMGFAAGDFIIKQILKSSGLEPIENSGQNRYYARP